MKKVRKGIFFFRSSSDDSGTQKKIPSFFAPARGGFHFLFLSFYSCIMD